MKIRGFYTNHSFRLCSRRRRDIFHPARIATVHHSGRNNIYTHRILCIQRWLLCDDNIVYEYECGVWCTCIMCVWIDDLLVWYYYYCIIITRVYVTGKSEFRSCRHRFGLFFFAIHAKIHDVCNKLLNVYKLSIGLWLSCIHNVLIFNGILKRSRFREKKMCIGWLYWLILSNFFTNSST